MSLWLTILSASHVVGHRLIQIIINKVISINGVGKIKNNKI